MQPKYIGGLAFLTLVLFLIFSRSGDPSPPTHTTTNTPASQQSSTALTSQVAKLQRELDEANTYTAALQERHLDILRDTLTGIIFRTTEKANIPQRGSAVHYKNFEMSDRMEGIDWPFVGITMAGVMRLDNIREALRDIEKKGIPGDFVECGVWRGGASIFAKSFFDLYKIRNRKVWVVDSFMGLPPARTGNDENFWVELDYLKIAQETVEENFRAFGVLDSNVEFVKGYFVDSLPHIKVKQIAVLRMDGDMYESTMDQLFNLYDRVPIGGWVIIDDFKAVAACQKAIADFRNWHGLSEPIITIDRYAAYFIKEKNVKLDMSKYEALIPKKP